ncbi:MAG TPA: hypothetical protein VMB66_07995 [Candidatus Acidoferrales bacterium]|nr:hypothetical protein [Candidatus Acidoferrales bacterium]
MKRSVYSGIGLTLLLAVAGLPATAQNQTSSNSQTSAGGQSLGEYARQVRKESGTSAKAKVFDNDNLPTQDQLSIVGTPTRAQDTASDSKSDDSSAQAPAPGSDNGPKTQSSAGTEDKSAANSAPAAPQDEATRQAAWKQWAERLKAQQDQIDLLNRELDVLQREYQLRAAAMYGDIGNRLRNSADWDKQDANYKQQIADKQKAVDDAKQKLDDLQEEARKAGVPSSVREP